MKRVRYDRNRKGGFSRNFKYIEEFNLATVIGTPSRRAVSHFLPPSALRESRGQGANHTGKVRLDIRPRYIFLVWPVRWRSIRGSVTQWEFDSRLETIIEIVGAHISKPSTETFEHVGLIYIKRSIEIPREDHIKAGEYSGTPIPSFRSSVG